jgi:L-lactate dehydrogenase complex protein LldE
MQVAFLATCMGDAMSVDATTSSVHVLERLGCEVAFPSQQTCCGQMHLNSGYQDAGLELARRLERVFDGHDVIVSPSSSCVGYLRSEVLSFQSRLYELSEFLTIKLGVEDVGAAFPHTVVYHPTCHSLRISRVEDAPVRLLQKVRGLELRQLARADECCGFGGTFAIKNAEASEAIAADKCACIEQSGAEFCTALDISCLLNIGGTLSRRRSSVQAIHLAEILAAT